MAKRYFWTRRAVLRAAAMAGFCDTLLRFPARVFGQSQARGGMESNLFQIQLINDGSSIAPANVSTDWFGVNFKAGDVPASDYFQFQLPNGTVQPFSSGGEAYYPDGSLLHANVRLKPTISIVS